MTKARTVLITGGAGFIGSHLSDAYAADGWRVLCVDNLLTGSLDNIAALRKSPRFYFIRHDITKPFSVKGGVDLVLNFASPASPVDYLEHPIETMKVGSLGTHNALGLAKAKKARFLQASTSEVYGDPEVHPQVEAYWGHVNPIGPRSVYDEAKRFSEALTLAYKREHRMDNKIVRIFNTYGPRMRADDGRVIPNFICQALRGEPLTVYGKGKQTRSFCFVDDLVRGIMALARSPHTGPVNLGNPGEYDMNELAEIVVRLTGARSKLVYKKLPQDDPKRRCPNIGLAKKLLKWAPRTQLKTGLRPTIAHFREKLGL